MASIALSSPVSAAPRGNNRGRFALVGLGTVVASVLGNLLVYALGSVVVGYNSGFIVLANASGAILFNIIAAIVFVVTLIPDFTYIPGVPGATVGQTAILVLMHIVAAAIIVGMLTRLARPQAR